MIIYIYIYRDFIHQSGFNYVQIIAFMCLDVSGSICIYVYKPICVCVCACLERPTKKHRSMCFLLL